MNREVFQKNQTALLNATLRDIALHKIQSPKEVASYEKRFRSELSSKPSPSSMQELTKNLLLSEIILVGDFHTFRLSQKTFLKIIENSKLKPSEISIALECIRMVHQNKLDHFIAGNITTKELLEDLDFEKYWHFPMEGFVEILSFARKNRIPLFAIDHAKNQHGDIPLKTRDRTAALTLIGKLSLRPQRKIFVLIGELHLAASHLPFQIKKASPKAKVLVVHQNLPKIFQKSKKPIADGTPAEVQKLHKNEFCLLNTMPWIKYKSYLNWIEGSLEDEWTSHSIDQNTNLEIAGRINLQLGGIVRKVYPTELITGDEEIRHLEKIPAYTHLIRWARENGRPCILPKSKIIICPSNDPNSVSEIAALGLAFSQNPPEYLLTTFVAGYFGSKVLNPKRKCSTKKDIRLYLESSKRPSKSHKLALSFLAGKSAKTLFSNNRKPDLISLRLVGYILGETLFQAAIYSKNQLAIEIVKKIFPFSLDQKEEKKILAQMIKIHSRRNLPSKGTTL